MTEKTYTFTLTAEQAEDVFDCINVASLYYGERAENFQRELGAYDWRLSSADKLSAAQARRDLFSRRWVEFYQMIKLVRAEEKAAKEGGAA